MDLLLGRVVLTRQAGQCAMLWRPNAGWPIEWLELEFRTHADVTIPDSGTAYRCAFHRRPGFEKRAIVERHVGGVAVASCSSAKRSQTCAIAQRFYTTKEAAI
jgi:hypothetical protein